MLVRCYGVEIEMLLVFLGFTSLLGAFFPSFLIYIFLNGHVRYFLTFIVDDGDGF